MIVLGEDAQRMKEEDAQSHNISAARAVAESVRSTLGPKGMDKLLVDDLGDITVTNDGVTILRKMEIDNPTAEMIVEVAKAQADEAGDGTTTAVAIAGDLLANAEDLLDKELHPTTVIRGFDLARRRAREAVDDLATEVDLDDGESLRRVARTAMTGKSTELDEEVLVDLVVRAVRAVSVEADDGSVTPNLELLDVQTEVGHPVSASELFECGIVEEDPVHETMPTEVEDAEILLLDKDIKMVEADTDAQLILDDPDGLQEYVEREDEQLEELVDTIADSGANVVLCQNGIDEPAQRYLAERGILAVRRVRKDTIELLADILETRLVGDFDALSADDVASGTVTRDDDDERFLVEGPGRGATLVLRGSTDYVVDELERGVDDALDVVATAVADGRVLPGGGAVEVELASRLRDCADSIDGREQLAVRAFADALEVVPRVLARNAGLDAIDTLVALRTAHESGEEHAGLEINSGKTVDSLAAGVVEPARAKNQAIASACEAATLVLKIDDIISAGGLSTSPDEEDDAPGGMM